MLLMTYRGLGLPSADLAVLSLLWGCGCESWSVKDWVTCEMKKQKHKKQNKINNSQEPMSIKSNRSG